MADGRGNSGYDAGSAPPQTDSALVTALAAAQNSDGGWPYRKGTSWTEPTVLALLALGRENPVSARGFDWLRGRQRSDGGWPPQAGVEQATWVTSLVALLPVASIGPERLHHALSWILGQMGTNSTIWFRLRERLLGSHGVEENPGWPWFPGTAAWVTPTALAMLALGKAAKRQPADEIQRRIEQGREFLLSRRCADGGWNHGSSHALGYDGNSYPETTGAALLALRGVVNLDKSIAAAERHWRECRSAEGAAWLKLGLLVHGRKTEGWPPQSRPRNIRDSALCVLADRAEQGHNAFVD
jgi:prenyltransferase/squalene oxidase-like repeat protein